MLSKITIILSQLTLDFDVNTELTSQTLSFRPTGEILSLREVVNADIVRSKLSVYTSHPDDRNDNPFKV
jgi:hypothetical protein